MTDAELAAAIPPEIREDLVECVRRLRKVPEAWGDLVEDLRSAERRQLTGVVTRGFHHDHRGEVQMVEMDGKKRRQARRSA